MGYILLLQQKALTSHQNIVDRGSGRYMGLEFMYCSELVQPPSKRLDTTYFIIIKTIMPHRYMGRHVRYFVKCLRLNIQVVI
jgi:hypothetical protein